MDPESARLHALSAARHLENVGCEREAVGLYLKNGDARDAVPALRVLVSAHRRTRRPPTRSPDGWT